ncbi:MAG: nicotinate phosphoribosyltransferase [Simkaniaceae bacterium]|nr:nicotinate phosphoribosyltransferase [Simkaniaceae bacterium]
MGPAIYGSGESLALFTDFYQLTMAYGYWKSGFPDRGAAFSLFFRKTPRRGALAIVAGLETAVDFVRRLRFDESDLAYLSGLRTESGRPFFDPPFLRYLRTLSFRCDIDAIPEGTPVFPYEPLLIVKGPILQAQLLETALLNVVNFQTLIATEAFRIVDAAEGDPVIEFGMRRAQGLDGAFSGTRAAFIGGCRGTSNVLAGKHFAIPVRGTQSHSWIMAFSEEREAFASYARVMPDSCIYLVDTYDTVRGIENAIATAKREGGGRMIGIRLDSGDLAQLSIVARDLLDQAGFSDAKIMASNEIDETTIRDLKRRGAAIDVWGVGTKLITGGGRGALDGVYKLSAVRNRAGEWVGKMKVSEQITKTTNPGILHPGRVVSRSGSYLFDILHEEGKGPEEGSVWVDSVDPVQRRVCTSDHTVEELLVPVMREGEPVYPFPPLEAIRARTLRMSALLSPSVRRPLNPEPYFVGLRESVYRDKMCRMDRLRSGKAEGGVS